MQCAAKSGGGSQTTLVLQHPLRSLQPVVAHGHEEQFEVEHEGREADDPAVVTPSRPLLNLRASSFFWSSVAGLARLRFCTTCCCCSPKPARTRPEGAKLLEPIAARGPGVSGGATTPPAFPGVHHCHPADRRALARADEFSREGLVAERATSASHGAARAPWHWGKHKRGRECRLDPTPGRGNTASGLNNQTVA